MVYFDQILHTNACQHYLMTGMCNSPFGMDECLLNIISAVENAHLLNRMVYLDQILHAYLF